ncbi:MAG TPA: prepilin peptidase [Clostridiales bacterium]|nr:MAG: hypothetical protein A2Y18_05515 [Clostridiales bacterium GWD2_32_19]HCC07445.1 prepilin peptidase [Clostridiales bacterium]
MTTVIMITLILVGLAIGSFLNVCIYRIPRKESIILGSSHCTSCNEKIRWYDMIPVVSYVLLKGKCRKCGERVSIRYPIVEMLNALLYIGLFYKYTLSNDFYIFAITTSIFIVIGVIDYEHQIIPNRLIAIFLVIAIVYRINWFTILGNDYGFLFDGIIAAFGAFLVFFLLMTLSGGGMGGGDVKLIFPVGLMFGIQQIAYVVLVSSVAASIYAIILIIAKKANRKTPIPFGTFLAMGVYIMIMVGL